MRIIGRDSRHEPCGQNDNDERDPGESARPHRVKVHLLAISFETTSRNEDRRALWARDDKELRDEALEPAASYGVGLVTGRGCAKVDFGSDDGKRYFDQRIRSRASLLVLRAETEASSATQYGPEAMNSIRPFPLIPCAALAKAMTSGR